MLEIEMAIELLKCAVGIVSGYGIGKVLKKVFK